MYSCQFGFSIFGLFVLWFSVSQDRFLKKVAPMFLYPGQRQTVSAEELLPMFTSSFIMRDGWRLYRVVSRTPAERPSDSRQVF